MILDRFLQLTSCYSIIGEIYFVCVSRIARPSGRNWVGLYEAAARYGGYCCFQYMYRTCNISTAYRRDLVAVFKVNCFPFLNCFAWFLLDIIFPPSLPSRTVYSLLLHLDPREKFSSPIQDLFCSRKPLTYPGSASVQCGLHGRTDYPLSRALTFFTQTSVSYWTLLLSRK